MCGIVGAFSLTNGPVQNLPRSIEVMNDLIKHRGPDGVGTWIHPRQRVGFGHRRLSIIDLATGNQPMVEGNELCLIFNGEIYNYIELREQIGAEKFKTASDTEVILRGYQKWGEDVVHRLRGMFSFMIWDERRKSLFGARDRFGIKPFYYLTTPEAFYFASEAKALLPFLESPEVDYEGLNEYFTFQFPLNGKTLLKNVREIMPGHQVVVKDGQVNISRYWQVYYNLDFDHTEKYFSNRMLELLEDSVDVHRRADVPIGGYVSGGLDSSIVSSIAAKADPERYYGFTGKFTISEKYDESKYARDLANFRKFKLFEIDIQAQDFIDNIRKVIYHLDFPVAGPGSFPQYMVSGLAAKYRKVVLGGQGGDEIFGGYARYLIAYFEQCIKAGIEGTTRSGNFIVTYESIIPNLTTLKEYKSLLQEFWREGLFQDLDARYFRLVNRAPSLGKEIRWEMVKKFNVFETFRKIFRADNVSKESYFDSMTHFDFKTLLPALLQVEDRVSMAHGLESRVPFLDHPLVEFAATMPSNVKFKEGKMKHILRETVKEGILPDTILHRKDKMGFPTPLSEWFKAEARDFVHDIFHTQKNRGRDIFDSDVILNEMEKESQFGRKIWGLLSLELWFQEFVDKHAEYRRLLNSPCESMPVAA